MPIIDLLTEPEAAQLLRVSSSTLRHDRIGPKKIPFMRIGARILYDTGALERYIAAQVAECSGTAQGQPT